MCVHGTAACVRFWPTGMLEADEKYFKEHGEPLFSSHMVRIASVELCCWRRAVG